MPSYRLHQASGQAVVALDGSDDLVATVIRAELLGLVEEARTTVR